MDSADRARFSVVLNWLAGKYPLRKGGELVPRELPAKELNDWFDALHDIHIERIEWAAKYHFGHSSFFPSPADLRHAAPMAPVPKMLPKKGQRQIAEAPVPTPESTRQWRQMLADLKRKMGVAV